MPNSLPKTIIKGNLSKRQSTLKSFLGAFLLLTGLLISSEAQAQCPPGAVCATYTAGDIASDFDFQSLGDTSTCIGSLTVTIPAGNWVDSISTSYDFTAAAGAWMSEQRSWLYSPSSAQGETSLVQGTGTTGGTLNYNRTGLDFANTTIGSLTVEMHAGRTWGGGGCDPSFNKIDSATWEIIVYHSPVPSCLPPTGGISFTNLTSSGADFSWNVPSPAPSNGYEYEVRSSGAPGSGTVGLEASGVSGTNSVTINTLNPSSPYSIYVRSDCGSAFSPWTSGRSFTTAFACPPNAVCATYTNGDIQSDRNFTALPGTPACIGEVELVIPNGNWVDSVRTFYDFTAAGSAWMSEQRSRLFSPTTGQGEPSLATGSGTTVGTFSYLRGNLNFANFATDTLKVQMHAGRTFGGSACDPNLNYINDASWTVIAFYSPTPACTQPVGINPVRISNDTAVMSWNGGNGSKFQVNWGPAGFTQGSPASNFDSSSVRQFTMSGLSGNTAYDFYVMSDCRDSANGFSSWFGPFTFVTTCDPFTAPYSNNFDTDSLGETPLCWDNYLVGGGIGFSAAAVEAGGFNPARSAPNHVRLYNFNNDTTALISPQFTDLPGDSGRISFYARSTSTVATGNELVIGTISSPSDIGSFSAIDTISLSSNYTEYIVDITSANGYVGQHEYVVLVHAGATFRTYYIDDFKYEAIPACNPPLSNTIETDFVSFNGATVKWGSSAGITTFVEWGAVGFTPGTGALGRGSAAGAVDEFTITGLAPQTTYEYYIQDSCLGTLSPYVGPYQFTTACSPQSAPFVENFDGSAWTPGTGFNMAGDAIDLCWRRTDRVATNTWSWNVFTGTTSSSFGTGPSGDNTTGNDNYIVTEGSNTQGNVAEMYTPLVDVSSLNTPYFEFFYHRYGSVMPDFLVEINDGSSWDTLFFSNVQEHFANNDPYTEIGFDISSYGDTVQVRFSAFNNGCCNSDMAFDDVSFIEAPSCPKVNNLAANVSSDSSATLSWDGTSQASSYLVYFGPAGFAQGTNVSLGNLATTSTASLLFDTLSANTCYDYWVRPLCAPGDTGEARGPFTFCTPCTSLPMPYFQSYNNWPPSCWTVDGGSQDWVGYNGIGGDNYAEASFWTYNGDSLIMRSPVIDMASSGASQVRFFWSHLYSTFYPDDSMVVRASVLGSNQWEVIFRASGPNNFNDPTAGNTTPGNFIEETIPLDTNLYNGNQVIFEIVGYSDWGPDLFINDFFVEVPVNSDLSLLSARFLKDGKCLSSNDTIEFTVLNNIGSTYNLSNDPLVVNYAVSGPVNSTGNASFNSGIIEPDSSRSFLITGVDLSLAGSYSLDIGIAANNHNLSPINDSIAGAATVTTQEVWKVEPDSVVFINNPSDTVIMSASSSFFSGSSFKITEVCHFKTTNGAPSGGWPAYLTADDYIEITGVPGSDLGGITLEQWSATALTGSFTFPSGTMLSPNGTAIIAVGQLGSSSPSPTNFYYHGNGSYTGSFGSATAQGRILKDASGQIIDAMSYSGSGTYSFPAASGVTATDWNGNTPSSTSTSGIRLEGPDLNNATGWVGSATSPQDPNTLNANVPLPSASSTAGFSWTFNGQLHDSLPETSAGPYTQSGTYNYIASFNTPCGTFTDTVVVIVNLGNFCAPPTNLSSSNVECAQVDLDWTSNSGSSVIQYGPQGFVPGTGSFSAVVSPPYTLTGLNPGTAYDIWIADTCGGDTSSFAGPINILTDSVPLPIASFDIVDSAHTGNTYEVMVDASSSLGATGYIWLFDNGTGGLGVRDTAVYTTNGVYTITLIVSNGCGRDTATRMFNANIGLAQNQLERSLAVFPNPSREMVEVSFSSRSNASVNLSLLDAKGRVVYQLEDRASANSYRHFIDLSDLAVGIYMLEIRSGEHIARRRVGVH